MLIGPKLFTDQLRMQIPNPSSSELNDSSQLGIAMDYDAFDLQDEMSSWQANGPYNQTMDFVSSDFDIHLSRNGSPRGRWCKIRAAMMWVSVWKDVTAKRMAEFDPFSKYSD